MELLATHSAALPRIRRWFALRGCVATDTAIIAAALECYEKALAGVDAVVKTSPRVAANERDNGGEVEESDSGWSL